MYKTILVPLDGSSRAEEALPVAADIATHTGATIVLVRVVIDTADEYWPAVTVPYPLMGQTIEEGKMKQAMYYLQGIRSFSCLTGLQVETTARSGSAVSGIIDTAREYRADLIMMSSHRHGRMVSWIKGSVVGKVSHHAPVPVLVVQSGAGPVQPAQPLRILVPLDGSVYAKMALEPAATLLAALASPGQKQTIHLVRAVHVPTSEKEEEKKLLMQREAKKARRYLKQTAELIQEGYIAPTIARQQIPLSWSVALDTDIAHAIVRTAENGEDAEGAGVFGGCDVLAIATHGREGLQRWAMGSVTEEILQVTKRSLLIIPPQQIASTRKPSLEKVSSFQA